MSLLLGFYEMGPPVFATLDLQTFPISFLMIFLLLELVRNVSGTFSFVIGSLRFGFSLAAGYGSLEGILTRWRGRSAF